MPNGGHHWTSVEERAALTKGWPEFNALFPHITRNAWRIRRNSLRAQGYVAAGDKPIKTACKVCAFIASLPPETAAAWRADLAAPVKGTGSISHRAAESALRNAGVDVEESSIRRHRRNHIGK